MIARLLLPGLVAMLLAPAFANAQDQPLGTYTYVKGQRGDQKVADEDLKGNTVRIEENRLFLVDAEGNTQFEIRFEIDDEPVEGQVKATMEIVKSDLMPDAVGARAKVLAKANGDEITLIYDFESTSHPESFEPKGTSQHLFVLKKAP